MRRSRNPAISLFVGCLAFFFAGNGLASLLMSGEIPSRAIAMTRVSGVHGDDRRADSPPQHLVRVRSAPLGQAFLRGNNVRHCAIRGPPGSAVLSRQNQTRGCR